MAFPAIHLRTVAVGEISGAESNRANSLPTAGGPARRPLCLGLLNVLDRWRGYVLAAVVAVYLLGFNGQWLIEPDGGLYLNLARNLARGRGYTFGGIPHDTVYPGLPVALAGLYHLFPAHFIFAADAFVWLCALASLALVYRLVLLAYDRPTAVAIALGVAISSQFYHYSFEILTEMPFLAGITAVLAGHEGVFGSTSARRARWWDWALLVGGLAIAITTRPTMIALLAAWIAALAFAAVVRRNWKAGGAIAICAALLGIFLIFDPRRNGGNGLGGYEQYAIHQLTHSQELKAAALFNLGRLFNPLVAKAVFGMRLGSGVWGWLNAVFGAISMAAAVALFAKRAFWGLWVIASLATVILTVSDDRYLLPILPLIVLGWWNLIRSINLRLPRRIANPVFVLLLALGTLPNVVMVAGTIIHQRSRPFLETYQNGKYQAVAQMAAQIPSKTLPDDVILCPAKLARIMAFLSDRMFYEQNEPFWAPAGHLLMMNDPEDWGYSLWLRDQNVSPVGDALITVPRPGQPPISLIRAKAPGNP
ncbi:MAG: hypothetical protein ABSB42_08440 [Tepidisphaeraceae bacterium]|jgi:hypothetical protein